jgi:NAD(P)-dependent dehydrogenase (short-subunit alcohol dehydrogenase family)
VWAGFRKNIPDELKQIDCIEFCRLDVTDDSQVRSVVAAILKKEGRIDALINHAGYGLIGPEEWVTLAEAQKLFDVNFFCPLRLIQAVLPAMKSAVGSYP